MSEKQAVHRVEPLDVECAVCGAVVGEPCRETVTMQVASDTLKIVGFDGVGVRAQPHNSRELVARWTRDQAEALTPDSASPDPESPA